MILIKILFLLSCKKESFFKEIIQIYELEMDIIVQNGLFKKEMRKVLDSQIYDHLILLTEYFKIKFRCLNTPCKTQTRFIYRYENRF